MKTDKTSSVKAHKSRLNKGVWIIIIAAVLLELLSAVQYYSTRQLLSDEHEQKEEMGLRMKAIVIKNTLNAAKSTLYDHIWDMQRNLEEPYSMFSVVEWLVRMNHTIKGGGMAFIPDYYPQKGRLFEPYARRSDSTVLVRQIAGENHDYTQREFYYSVLSSDKSVWTEPYEDKEGAGTEPDLISEGTHALRIFALSFIPFCYIYVLMIVYKLYSQHKMALFISFALSLTVIPVLWVMSRISPGQLWYGYLIAYLIEALAIYILHRLTHASFKLN